MWEDRKYWWKRRILDPKRRKVMSVNVCGTRKRFWRLIIITGIGKENKCILEDGKETKTRD